MKLSVLNHFREMSTSPGLQHLDIASLQPVWQRAILISTSSGISRELRQSHRSTQSTSQANFCQILLTNFSVSSIHPSLVSRHCANYLLMSSCFICHLYFIQICYPFLFFLFFFPYRYNFGLFSFPCWSFLFSCSYW